MQATALEVSMYFLRRNLFCLSTSVEAVHCREERGNLFSEGHLYIDKKKQVHGVGERKSEERIFFIRNGENA